MNYTVLRDSFSPCEFDKKEILRYAGVYDDGENISALVDSCIDKLKDNYTFNVCYTQVMLSVNNDICDFGAFSVNSKSLSKLLSGCDRAVIFAATLGLSADRIIAKYSKISPSHAIILDAIGTERIETLCDMFCERISQNLQTTSRFSAGYGDVPLEIQKNIFSLLDCHKHIGLTLNDSLMMSPSKSVTAIVGIKSKE
jgi:hypothetical protein